jgi:hypothetical protein
MKFFIIFREKFILWGEYFPAYRDFQDSDTVKYCMIEYTLETKLC